MTIEFKPDASGAYINPDELNRLADKGHTDMRVHAALRCAALEILRQRGVIDQLQAQLDAS